MSQHNTLNELDCVRAVQYKVSIWLTTIIIHFSLKLDKNHEMWVFPFQPISLSFSTLRIYKSLENGNSIVLKFLKVALVGWQRMTCEILK
jgi:hypothetical protein